MTGAVSTRLRYRRLVPFATSVLVTATSLIGAANLALSNAAPSYAAEQTPAATPTGTPSTGAPTPGAMSLSAQKSRRSTAPTPSTGVTSTPSSDSPSASGGPTTEVPPPADSGSGRRVVFDQSEQRVWLVDTDGVVERTYLVSGSLTDNLHPGTYQVTRREMNAIGIDNSGTMRYFVVFTAGQHAAIGFHDIPVKDGHLVQTRAQLGTPQSHGCIRQWRPDAVALWRFAPDGTKVVVTA